MENFTYQQSQRLCLFIFPDYAISKVPMTGSVLSYLSSASRDRSANISEYHIPPDLNYSFCFIGTFSWFRCCSQMGHLYARAERI